MCWLKLLPVNIVLGYSFLRELAWAWTCIVCTVQVAFIVAFLIKSSVMVNFPSHHHSSMGITETNSLLNILLDLQLSSSSLCYGSMCLQLHTVHQSAVLSFISHCHCVSTLHVSAVCGRGPAGGSVPGSALGVI